MQRNCNTYFFRSLISVATVLSLFLNTTSYSQKIHKFERIGVVDGLSQNFVQSILCDDKGFLWFGTWDGLNRYDGRQFKVFRVNPDQENSLTSNRIIDIWQDKQNTIWVKTNDDYIHYFVEETYEFITYPYYLKSLEERNSTITCFVESNKQEVLLGSSNSGLYYLTYNHETDSYDERQYLNRGSTTISDNTISFIFTDDIDDIWIGTKRGLNNISQNELKKESPSFSHYWLDYSFTVGFKLDSILLFGTHNSGIKTYEPHIRRFDTHPSLFSQLENKSITIIESMEEKKLMIGTQDDGLYVFDLNKKILDAQFLQGKTIRKIYKDSYGIVWVNTNEFGIYKFDPKLEAIEHHEFIDENIKSMVPDERQQIYEDSNLNLWIVMHGGGLAYYNRNLEEFEFYRNQPSDNSSISSNNVYCITEDQSGMLWVGTGIPDGGVNKLYTSNEAFQQISLEKEAISGNENIVRSIFIDKNQYTWLGTKSGIIYILDGKYQLIKKLNNYPLLDGSSPRQNAYTMLQDNEGHLWIGTKGNGIFVTDLSINDPNFSYKTLKFINYKNIPEDENSLSSDIIYSIKQDKDQRIWIGSYEGGLNLVTHRDSNKLSCQRYTTANSSISNDKVRYLYEDGRQRLWITTVFGINYLDLNNFDQDSPKFTTILFDPRQAQGLSYSDVIHVYEDSRSDLWFATYGRGVSRLIENEGDSLRFQHLNTNDGLINDVVYSIAEDKKGWLWFSTDHGISRYNPVDSTFENFDQSNDLTVDVFNENACAVSADGRLLFGTNDGLLLVHPDKIQKNEFMPNVVFTNMQLFNRDVDITDSESPVQQDIETLDEITLNYFQSSFSIEYAALSYFAPTKNKYAYMLENFDEQWNEVGNQNKATYTNLPPGAYTFKVKAANWNSDWNEEVREIKITILTPWWKTDTMYIVYTIIMIVIIIMVTRSYNRYHQLQNDLKVEKRVNDIKLQFFTNISHEIRTPLTLILGPIHDIMDLKNIPKNIANKLHLIEKNGKRMLRLVNQLLDFRKVQKNKMNLRIHKIELISFMRSIVENFDLVADHKKVKIIFIPQVQTKEVWVDPNKFDSVIFNILSNALKFSPQGREITIDVVNTDENQVQITISDQGTGIPKNRINQLFERFSPLVEDDEEFGSSGIGLAYSYQIMKLHQGDISVNSELNKGSAFNIKILEGNDHFSEEEIQHDEVESLYKIKHEKVIEDDEVVQTHEKEQSKKENHILIVEDNLQILVYLKENLQADYSISTALNGKEALVRIDEKEPDILITDIMMPVMSGTELTHKLKDSIDTSHIPVIMLTAKSSMEDQIEGIECGAEAYILKPFNMSYVNAVINNLIKQRKLLHSKYVQEKEGLYSNINISNKDEKFLEDINILIRDNYSEPSFNIEKLVEMSYVSRTVFYNKIKALTGLAPVDFLRQKRLHIASQLIIKSDYNISEIAVITGFNDAKYFSKRFKEIYKLTPSQYKEELLLSNKHDN